MPEFQFLGRDDEIAEGTLLPHNENDTLEDSIETQLVSSKKLKVVGRDDEPLEGMIISYGENETLKGIRDIVETKLEFFKNFTGWRQELEFFVIAGGKPIEKEEEGSKIADDNTALKLNLRPPPSKGFFEKFLLGVLGWNPPKGIDDGKNVFRHIFGRGEGRKRSEAAFYLFFLTYFVLDIVDFVVDLCLAYSVLDGGTDSKDEFAILLLVMTIFPRIVTGMHGVIYNRANDIIPTTHLNRKQDKPLTTQNIMRLSYFVVEIMVFMMEDGAATLFLLKNPPEKNDTLKIVNLVLTATCGLLLFVYIIIQALIMITKLFHEIWSMALLEREERRNSRLSRRKKVSLLLILYFLPMCVMLSISYPIAWTITLILVTVGNDEVCTEDGRVQRLSGDGVIMGYDGSSTYTMGWRTVYILYGVGVALCLVNCLLLFAVLHRRTRKSLL